MTPTSQPPVAPSIEAISVTHRFGPFTAVDDVSMRVDHDEIEPTPATSTPIADPGVNDITIACMLAARDGIDP